VITICKQHPTHASNVLAAFVHQTHTHTPGAVTKPLCRVPATPSNLGLHDHQPASGSFLPTLDLVDAADGMFVSVITRLVVTTAVMTAGAANSLHAANRKGWRLFPLPCFCCFQLQKNPLKLALLGCRARHELASLLSVVRQHVLQQPEDCIDARSYMLISMYEQQPELCSKPGASCCYG